MELKTRIIAEEGKHDLIITRDFELPVELLFTAHVDPEIFEQWMTHEYGTTKVVKLEGRRHGGWHFQNINSQGVIVFQAYGVFHDFIINKKIVRTFEMENSPFDAQLEFLDFESLGEDQSRLTINSVYRSGKLRDEMLKLPFQQGLNMAHNRLQNVVSKLKR